MSAVRSAIACNLDADILSAALPLLEDGKVEAIEWSFDTLFQVQEIPGWFLELLQAFSEERRLIGHGVFFSLFSGRWSAEQANWLKELQRLSSSFQFDHITEHFGFLTGRDFHSGAPLNIPYSDTTLRIGRDRLARIADACRCPVGLENLAFSYSPEEVKKHGEFLEALVTPVNGFIILDLHNLYCQLHNFSIPYEELIRLYPLHRVREIHISGGSWVQAAAEPGRVIRRDTHDDTVPPDVHELLRRTIGQCPNLKYVVLEQLGDALKTEESRAAFRKDFTEMEAIVQAHNGTRQALPLNDFLPAPAKLASSVAEDETLHRQQMELSDILETATDCSDALQRLQHSSLAGTEWQIEQWRPYMVETAVSIAQKWKAPGGEC